MLFDNALFHMRQQDFVPVTAYPELCRPEVGAEKGGCLPAQAGSLPACRRSAVCLVAAQGVRA